MKQISLTILILLLGMKSFSQKKDMQITSSNKNFGFSSSLNKEITGIEHIFPVRIHQFYIDTISNYLTVQLRGLSKNGKWLDNSGNVVLFDLNKSERKWSKA